MKRMKQFITLAKLKPGDQVAVLSPSAGPPGLFPWVQDLGLKRMRDELNLIPKEYPTTRTMDAPLADRARDVMAAFSDPDNHAVFASIGGQDQVQLLKLLDANVLRQNPKPFFGYSDNTHLHLFLWNLGIPSYYGGSIMTEFAFQNGLPELTLQTLRQALFTGDEMELTASDSYNDIGLSWSDQANLSRKRVFEPNEGHIWSGTADASGVLWGGCVESLIAQMTTGIYLPSDADLDGTILLLETAEDIPEPWIIEYLLTGFGERGWLRRFNGILVGRPKAWEYDKPLTAEQKAAYKREQQDTVQQTVRRYNKTIPIVQNVDFGHTAPQAIMPLGKTARLVSSNQKIYLQF